MTRILVIDDEPTCLQAMATILENAGYSVDEAPSADEGLESYRREKPDLVICDVFLPGKDGVTFLMELKKEDPQAKIVLISGHWDRLCVPAGHLGEHLGAVAVLEKPLAAPQFRQVVENALNAQT